MKLDSLRCFYFIAEERALPCPEKWQYVPLDGSCYRILPEWTEYSWEQADAECKNLNKESSLWYLDDDGVDDFVQSAFMAFQNAYFWLAANYSSGIRQLS